MSTTSPNPRSLKLERIERDEEKQGHDGRIRSRHWILWQVVDEAACEAIAEYTTKREAVARLAKEQTKIAPHTHKFIKTPFRTLCRLCGTEKESK